MKVSYINSFYNPNSGSREKVLTTDAEPVSYKGRVDELVTKEAENQMMEFDAVREGSYQDYLLANTDSEKKAMARQIARCAIGFVRNAGDSIDMWLHKFRNEEYVLLELSKITVMRSVRWFVENIKNKEIREKCLENLDERFADEMCYSAGYALMLGVNQPAWERSFWENAYLVLRTESPGHTDNSKHYKLQPVQQESKKQ